MNYILEYYRQIQSGEVTVSKKIERVYSKLARDCEKGCVSADGGQEWYYSQERADHVIAFVERFCKHSKGKFGGQPVILELWEKAMLSAVFGFIDDEGNRKYREAILIVGKKNGKSLISSAVGNYMLFGDGEAGAEIYAVATKKDQAKIIWNEAKRMVKKSPALSKRARCLVSEIINDSNDGVFKALASDSNTMDGLNVHCGLMDEVHQWTDGMSLYNIIADGVTARTQPLIFITTTAGFVREDVYDIKYEEAERILDGYDNPEGYHDERRIPFIYELDARAEWTDPKCWAKANPGLGTIKNLEALAEKVERAKENPYQVKNLLCKEFNIRETSSESWLTFEEIRNTETFNIQGADGIIYGAEKADYTVKPVYGLGGVDLSATTDLCAAKIIFQVAENAVVLEKFFVVQCYWLPEDLLDKRVKEDQIPYDLWYEQGLLRLCKGNRINPHDVTLWFIEMQEKLDIYFYGIGYDEWGAAMWAEEMRGYFGRDTMIPVRQGVKTLSAPMKLLGADLQAHRIIYNWNPIDEWCLQNTSYIEDKNGNIQPKKTSNARRRIDGTAALLDAYVVFREKEEEYKIAIGG